MNERGGSVQGSLVSWRLFERDDSFETLKWFPLKTVRAKEKAPQGAFVWLVSGCGELGD